MAEDKLEKILRYFTASYILNPTPPMRTKLMLSLAPRNYPDSNSNNDELTQPISNKELDLAISV